MPPFETQNLHQTAILWEKVGDDFEGEPKVSSPVQIPCRWEDTQSQMVAPDGAVIGLSANVVVRRDIPIDSLMMQGTLPDLSGTGFDDDDPAIMQVKSVRKVPDLKDRVFTRIVSLQRFRGKLPTNVLP